MSRLILAEKHSVGQAIAQALGHAEKHDGYMQVGDDLITWAQGHLVDLAAPDEYKDHDWSKWSLNTLPIDPTPAWRWKVSREKGADRQYKVVASLMRRDDVGSLVNACDPDREGEAIFHRIVAHAGVDKPMRRLWVASLEEDAIREALASMKDETDYQGLADAAMIRAKADWLIGMNASRAYSLVYNARFAVGRVQTPTLAMIVDRDRRIAGHVAQPYWKVVAPMGGWKLTGERLDKRTDAEALLRIVNSDDFTFQIFKVDRKQQHDAPPRLYDLTNLQKDMSKLHGLTAARTLAALQSLYEKKLATYPRTDSQFITHDDLDTLRGLVEGDRLVTGFIEPAAKPERPRLELTVNDAKVAGHTAILPTMQANASVLDGLTEDERLVLTRVARRMWEAVGDDYVHDVTNVVANIDPAWMERHQQDCAAFDESQTRFTSRSDQPVSLGWHAIENAKAQEENDDGDETAGNIIPANLVTGISIALIPQCGATLSEGKTKPPKPFTEATLLAAMEHASRWVEDKELKAALDDDESHSGGIGTPATRADVIEKLIRTGYVERKGKQLRSTKQGQELIDVVAPKLKDVALTADMERQLSQVEHGQTDAAQIESEFRGLAAGIPADAQKTVQKDHVQQTTKKRDQESVGPCPRCGADVVKVGKFWQCITNRREKQADGTWKQTAGCGFKIWPQLSGKTLTDAQVRKVLAGQKVTVKGFTSRRTGKKFDADIIADKDRGVRFDFGGGR